MKILFLTAWYPDRYDPMPGLFVKQHAEAVSESHSIAVLYVHSCDTYGYQTDLKSVNGVRTMVVYYPGVKKSCPGSSLIKGYRMLKAQYKGYACLKNEFGKPDLVHVNILTRCGMFALLLKYVASIPYVITEHWSRYLPSRKSYKGMLRKCLTRLVVRNSNGLVTVSEALKRAMINQGLDHKVFQVIPNSVDTEVFVPGKGHPEGKKIISHISCFDDEAKNISGIIRSVYRLAQKRQDFELHLIGNGPDKKRMEALSQSLDLFNKFVFFDGLLEGPELVKAYQRSAFTVLFSNYENMPVVIGESLSCGVPVIAARVGGLPEVIDERNGILIDPGDENALEMKMDEMIGRYTEYSQNVIRENAISRFGKGIFVKAYNDFYSYIYPSKTHRGKVL